MAKPKFDAEFFLVWESSCRNFIDKVRFASEEAKRCRLKVHVFLRRDTPAEAMPPSEEENEWIEHHFSLTSCPYASETAAVSFIIQSYSAVSVTNGTTLPPNRLYMVCERKRQYDELVAILTASRGACQMDVCQVDGSTQSIYDVIRDACKVCKLIFTNEVELKEHNSKTHDYFCDNRNYSRGGFPDAKGRLVTQFGSSNCTPGGMFCIQTEPRGERKVLSEMRTKFVCQFCPAKLFSTQEQRDIHMKLSHKKCNCSCGQYFETREDYLKHFYEVYPLSCFENRKCPRRFQSVFLQADHHRDSHNSMHPFYCVPCHWRKVNEGGKQREYFKDEKRLRIHGMALGHNEDEMFISNEIYSPALGAPDQRRSPSRTCSAINFC